MALEYSDMCRLCMNKNNVNVYIFCKNSIIDTIDTCLPIKVIIEDHLPKKICNDCYVKLEMIHKFRETVRNSNSKYQTLLAEEYLLHCSGEISKESTSNDVYENRPSINYQQDISGNNCQDGIQSPYKILYDNEIELVDEMPIDREVESVPMLGDSCYKLSDARSLMNLEGTNKTLPDTEEVVQGLMQIKGLTIKKTSGEAQSKFTTKRKLAKSNLIEPDVSLDTISAKLSRTEIVIKKVSPNSESAESDNFALCMENDEGDVDNDDSFDTESMEMLYFKEDCPTNIEEDEEDDEVYDEDPSEDYIPNAEKKKNCIRPVKMEKIMKPDRLRQSKIATGSRNKAVIEIKTTSTYVCMSCSSRFSSYAELRDHMKSNEQCRTVNLTCEVCSKVFTSKKQIYQHMLTHREKQKYICDECGKTYTNIFTLENHKAVMHGEQEEMAGSVYKCKVCSLTFVKRKELFAHINKHTKEQVHLCDACGKCFSTEDNLRSHIRIHSDVRPFPCDSCDKKFRTRLALIQHSHRHTGIKPYICDVCGKAFAKKSSLNTHARLHTGEVYSYECHLCLQQFSSPAKLKTHIKFHP